MDAPYHYGPVSGGRPAWRIGEVPLEWCTGEGAVLDMAHKADGETITADDLAACAALDPAGDVPPIVLVRTGASRHWGRPDYPERGSGLDADATAFLLEQGVRVIGIDAWGLDRPFSAMRADYRRTGNTAAIWPAHFVGRARPYLQLEKLTNLERLPARGFRVFAFPVKITGAGAAWCRVVAETP
jgi:kynurenine formamidase